MQDDINKKHKIDLDKQAEHRYLLFQLGSELYATPLLSVREIIERQSCKPIPHVAQYFLGVINLRGQITGVIDLRLRFGIPETNSESQVFMVFTTDTTMLAALVDRVVAVITILPDAIDHDPHVPSKVPMDFLSGIAKHGQDLVSIINLNALLSADEYVIAQTFKKSA